MQTKFFRVLAIVGMLALTIGPSTAALAADVTTSATVAAGGSGPAAPTARIECKWELADVNSSLTTGGTFDPAIQYGQDNNAAASAGPTLADGSTAATPCQLGAVTTADPVGKPTQVPGARHVTQILPNAHDFPEQKRVQVWVAVDGPSDGSGISTATNAVNWDIYHPDGTLKIEVYGTRVPTANCGLLGTATNSQTVFGAAVTTGQVAATAVSDPTRGLAYWCTQGKQFWFSSFRISKHQPCGEYRVVVNVLAGNGTTASLTNTLDVICFTNLELDFNGGVNYGTITPGFSKVIPGDLKWEGTSPANVAQDPGPVMATVRNTGNSGMTISVNFTEMCNNAGAGPLASGLCPTGVDKITSFDACFAAAATYTTTASTADPAGPAPYAGQANGVTAQPLFSVNPILANTTTTVRDPEFPGNQTLCANRLGKLDLSIKPSSGIAAGTYTGKLTVLSVASPRCLTDFGHADTTQVTDAANPNYPGLPIGSGIQPGTAGA